MPKQKDPRIDSYIAKAAPFARPILKRLRKLVHEGCPGVAETIKWRMPWFEYHGPLCGMAAFQAHCGFIFWRDVKLVTGRADSKEAMGQFGRITTLDDLPKDATLLSFIRNAAALRDLNARPAKPTRRAAAPRRASRQRAASVPKG